MDLGIENKNVLITGASQGIGKAIALEFAKEKCNVSIIARRKDKLEEVINEMGNKKHHSYYSIDLFPKGEPTRAIQNLMQKNEGYDIVVHNVGGTCGVKDVLSSLTDWENVFRFNAGIAMEINPLVVPYMKEKKWGRIIHISSLASKHLRGAMPYGCVKSFLNSYSMALGKALAKDGIVVSALMPSSIYSKGGHWDPESEENFENKEAFYKKREDFLKHYQPMGRLGTAEEIAPFAVFMASNCVSLSSSALIPIGSTELLGL